MKYQNAKAVLPDALVKELQNYVQGEFIYIPVEPKKQKRWGEVSGYRKELKERNKNIKEEFEFYIETENYKSILRVYNQKGMLPQSRLCAICGISNKESYLNLILSILKENKEDAEAIRKAIKHSLGT